MSTSSSNKLSEDHRILRQELLHRKIKSCTRSLVHLLSVALKSCYRRFVYHNLLASVKLLGIEDLCTIKIFTLWCRNLSQFPYTHLLVFSERMGSCSPCKIYLLIWVSYGEPENISNLIWSNLILSLSIWTYKFFSLMFYCRYFFAEVFDFFRNFFLIVFHGNILFMILPLAIRLKHRPFFLAFVYIVISSMLKSYPSVSSSLF